VKEAARELGKSPGGGAAFGAGMVLVPPLFQTTPSGSGMSVALIVCPNCQAHIPSTSRFCSNCGQNITAGQAQPSNVPVKKCSKCDAVVATGAKFCQSCGAKLD